MDHKKLSIKRGFTLLELLLVIAIIAVLAGIITFALRPAENIQNAEDVRVASSGGDLEKALKVYTLDNGGNLPSAFNSRTSGFYDICREGQNTDCINLDILKSTKYISSIPVDNNGSTVDKSGYKLKYDAADKNIQVYSNNEYQELTSTEDTLDMGLIRYLPMEEGSGVTTSDVSGVGNAASLCQGSINTCGIQGPTWTTGKFGNGLSFDGVDDGVQMSSITTTNYSHSLSAWIYIPSAPSAQKYILAANSGVGVLVVHSNLSLQYTACGGACGWGATSFSGIIPTNTWVHVAATFEFLGDSSARTSIYKNGVLLKSVVNNGMIYVRLGGVGMANHDGNNYSTSWWAGKLDEVRVYNRALTSGEVLTLYNKIP